MQKGKDNRNLTPDELSWFANEFAIHYCKTCIAIENLTNQDYDGFYAGFLDYFNDFLDNRLKFDVASALDSAYCYFHNKIHKCTNKLSCSENDKKMLATKPISGDQCMMQIKHLRELEERR